MKKSKALKKDFPSKFYLNKFEEFQKMAEDESEETEEVEEDADSDEEVNEDLGEKKEESEGTDEEW